MSEEECPSKWAMVEIQQNGIIRNKDGHVIGRLSDDVAYESEHVTEKDKTELEALKLVAAVAATCCPDLDINLKAANAEYLDGRCAKGAFDYTLSRHGSLYQALHLAGFTEKHKFFDYPVKPEAAALVDLANDEERADYRKQVLEHLRKENEPPQETFLEYLRKMNRIRAKEWHKGDEPDKDNEEMLFRSNELGGEAGEALDAVKKIARQRKGMAGGNEDINAVAEEIADVIICADRVAEFFDIDTEQAVRRKFNVTSRKNGFTTLMEEK